LLRVDADAGVLALELVEEGAHQLALRAHRPEAQRHDLRAPVRRRAAQREEQARARQALHSSHPPWNPARRSPRTTCAFVRITRHTRPLREFSVIARMGPSSM